VFTEEQRIALTYCPASGKPNPREEKTKYAACQMGSSFGR